MGRSTADRWLLSTLDGLWRISDEWGPVYSGVTTHCNESIRPVHDRMPVLLLPDKQDAWLHGDFDTALSFQQRCFPADLIKMERTAEPWVKRKAAGDVSGGGNSLF